MTEGTGNWGRKWVEAVKVETGLGSSPRSLGRLQVCPEHLKVSSLCVRLRKCIRMRRLCFPLPKSTHSTSARERACSRRLHRLMRLCNHIMGASSMGSVAFSLIFIFAMIFQLSRCFEHLLELLVNPIASLKAPKSASPICTEKYPQKSKTFFPNLEVCSSGTIPLLRGSSTPGCLCYSVPHPFHTHLLVTAAVSFVAFLLLLLVILFLLFLLRDDVVNPGQVMLGEDKI